MHIHQFSVFRAEGKYDECSWPLPAHLAHYRFAGHDITQMLNLTDDDHSPMISADACPLQVSAK